MADPFVPGPTSGLDPRCSRRGFIVGSAALAVADAAGGISNAGAAKTDSASTRLWYRQPAATWEQALPVGNGRIGAMVFGGVAEERLQLNEDTLWSGGPYDPVNPKAHAALSEVRRLIEQGEFARAQALADEQVMARPLSQMAYQVLGNLTLTMAGQGEPDWSSYCRELDIDAAMASTRFVLGGIGYRRDVIVSPDHQVIALHLSANRPAALSCAIAIKSPHEAKLTVAGGELLLAGRNGASHGVEGALTFAARVKVLPRGGTLRADGDRVVLKGAHEVTVLIAMATSYRRFDDVSGDPLQATQTRIAAAEPLGFAQLVRDTKLAHRRLFRRMSLDLGPAQTPTSPTDERLVMNQASHDPALAALYFNYGRYLLIASSRPGSQPANLQGIWNEHADPPWGSKYTININTEMNYWPAHMAALSECAEPLVELVRDLAVTGARTAKTMYGARGWVAHHNTDLWRATAPIDGAQWGLWPTGGAWLCTHLWDFYDYTRDLELLRSVYPLMRGAALFFVDTLQTDPVTGYLVTSPSISPENVHPKGASVCAGPAVDQQILRDLFAQTASAARLLDIDADFAAELLAERERLAPDRVGAQGQLQEWQQDWDAQAPELDHRHVSHLYALFPSDQIHPDTTPELARAARKSLEMRGDEATGWATAWRIALWARLREGDRAHRILQFLLGPSRTYPNMFDSHPPFQIDGNFGGLTAMAEMLVQSHGEDILLLPALPTAWPKGRVLGLRVRGACQVDLAWREGELRHATLTSGIAGERRVTLGAQSRVVWLEPGRALRLSGPDLHVESR
ncbi:glycoside hydrolase N-terminal domain-containing protein [Croceibacterium sp. LX-88]|uniref:Glycoside hydrolase N-terminal domain-containing protein n=1 Tax=Croceibacterium selenioxidans TaxID=2838833 RepID=A0ABS5W7N2_9SPHN|nr:glycoside hydrolase family 95 protein [Croceibacterium selenioxidans]MBT2135770.1 glycoside hydrolase N-terminal domain-containing protein [Croceibacterium selenioxidans]